ncbi:hypothetical protein GCM10028818_48040 [Spirosoma horti]
MRTTSFLPLFSIAIVFFLLSLSGCDINAIGPYYNLGKFQTRIIAENKVLAHLASRYDKLSSTDFEKISYTFDQSIPVTDSRHAVWYSKTDQELELEADIGSGSCAIWKGINKDVLRQLAISGRGLIYADSLGQSTGTNYRNCVRN